jgi:hypothetical protein
VNLSFDIHRLLPVVAVGVVALAAAVLVARGLGGGSTAVNAGQVLDRALKSEPKSGSANVRVNFTVGVPGRQVTSQLVTSGEGANAAPGRPVQERTHWAEQSPGKAPALHEELAVGGRGYIGVDGRWYQLSAQQYQRLFGSSKDDSLFTAQGFDPRRWIKNPKLGSTTSHVAGVTANQITGEVDAEAVLNDLGVYKGATSVQAQQLADVLRAAPKHGTMSLFAGKQDGILRKLSIVTQADAPKHVPPLHLTLSFALGIDNVNQPVKLAAPKGALPPGRIADIPRAKLGNRADKILGPAVRPAPRPAVKPARRPAVKPARRPAVKPARRPAPKPGKAGTRPPRRGAPATAKRSRQAYVGCVQSAPDLATLERCQALLP